MADLPDLAKLDYVERINRAIDHVLRHLAEPLRLDDVARAACFSPYHFHRIFRALVSETVHDFGGQWLGYQWDNPEIVPLEHCRYDVGLEIPAAAKVDGDASLCHFPAMKLAEVDIAGPIDLEMRALDWLYATWLPSSGFGPDHQPGFEAWNGEPLAHGMEHFELRVQLAVVAAAAAL